MNANATLSGGKIIAALKEARIGHVIAVPDLTTSEGVLWPLARDPYFKLIRICREEEGVGICTGLAFAGTRAALLIQYTGFLASMNAIRALALEYRQPICMLVGMLFADSPEDPSQSRNLGVSRMVPILNAIQIGFHLISNDESTAAIAPALDRAYAKSEPVAFLISRYPEP